MGGFNQLRRELNLKECPGYNHEEGDLVLVADHPKINPSSGLPSNYHYVGPITWKSGEPFNEKIPLKSQKKLIYFSIGSFGNLNLIKDFAKVVQEECHLVVTLGKEAKREDLDLPNNVTAIEFVNADLLLQHCHGVICHGGNGTLYQALRHGVPILTVANHLEQNYGGWIMEHLGVGKVHLRTKIEKKGVNFLVNELRNLLNDPLKKKKAQEFSLLLQNLDGAKEAYKIIKQFLADKNIDRTN